MVWQILGDVGYCFLVIRDLEFAFIAGYQLSHGPVNMLIKYWVGRGAMAMKPKDSPNCATWLIDEMKDTISVIQSRGNRAPVNVVSTD